MSDVPSTNGQVQTEKPASKNAADIDKLAAVQREQSERTDRLIAQLTAALAQSKAVAAMAPADSKKRETDAFRQAVTHEVALGRLKQQKLENGDILYSIAGDTIRTVGGLIRPAEAFVDRGVNTPRQHIEVLGTSDQQIATAMAHAARRWEGDAVVLHVEGKHTARVIEHAVRQGLNIVNKDVRIQQLVAAERERQNNPLVKDRSREARENVPLIERLGRSI